MQIEEAGSFRATGVDEVFDLAESVRLKHGDTVLTSDRVNYDRLKGIVHLYGNVRMIRGTTTLTADAAVYYEQDQRAIGAGQVRLDDALDGVVLTGSRMVFTQDPHRAVATGKPNMTWRQNESRINIEGFRLEYYFTETNSLLKALAEESVIVVDEGEGVTIYCEHAEYFKATDSARFSGEPQLVKRLEGDEGEIVATGKGMTYAFEDRTADVFDSVSVVKGTLEGICDTLRYDSEGQQIDLLGNPVIRSVHSEITGDEIILEMEDGEVARALVTGNAKGTYTAEEMEGSDLAEDLSNRSDDVVEDQANDRADQAAQVDQADQADQAGRSTIEGRSMVVDFKGESVRMITAQGNAVSTYNPSALESGPTGHNVVRAKEIVIELNEGEPVKVNADGGVDGSYLNPEDEDEIR
ncbi:MAG: hypothetical protein OXH56_12755 [Gemmatimonadetes bacterium]|nr:hypothetical protein [Gemmatimonadota bacterium]